MKRLSESGYMLIAIRCCACAVFCISAMSGFGYATGMDNLYDWGAPTAISVPSIVMTQLIAVALLLSTFRK